MMANKVVCCDDCFASIGKRSTAAARMWLELCSFKVASGIFGLKTDAFTEIRMLETMGFITTTEAEPDDVLLIKVNGDTKTYFCRGECDGKE